MALYSWLIAENAGKQYKSVFYMVDKNKKIFLADEKQYRLISFNSCTILNEV